jgi:hypothetical protein
VEVPEEGTAILRFSELVGTVVGSLVRLDFYLSIIITAHYFIRENLV